MYKILLSNDDGYDAPGLKVLFETLKEHAELFVVAPQINNSGAGCSITTNQAMFETKNDKVRGATLRGTLGQPRSLWPTQHNTT